MIRRPLSKSINSRGFALLFSSLGRLSLPSQKYTTMSSTKKARTHPTYELLYHPGKLPGRGEFIRLAFEAAGVSYKDVSNEQENGTVSHALVAESMIH
jgi:hypothetical protein